MRPTLKREFYLFRHGRPCHQSPRGSPSNPAFGSDGSTAHNLLREIRMRNADGLMTIDDAQEATCPCAPSSRYRSLKAQPLSQPLSSRIPIPIAIINLVAKYTSSGTRLSTCRLGRPFMGYSRDEVSNQNFCYARWTHAIERGFCCRSARHPQPGGITSDNTIFRPAHHKPTNAHHQIHHEPRKGVTNGACPRSWIVCVVMRSRTRYQDMAGFFPFSYFRHYCSAPGFDA